MRYALQTFVMVGDVLLFLAIIVLMYFEPTNPLTWIMAFLGIRAWHQQGGFMAWRQDSRRVFMENAKKLGL